MDKDQFKAALLALVDEYTALPVVIPPPVVVPPSHPGTKSGKSLVFADDFTGAGLSSVWANSRSSAFPKMGPVNLGDHKLSYLNANAVGSIGGLLTFTATKRSGTDFWDTGLITTEGVKDGFELLPGDYWETRVRLPRSGGAWASMWTWGRDRPQGYDGVQPGHGEIDVFEFHTHNGRILELSNHVRGGGNYFRAPFELAGTWVTLGCQFGLTNNIWYLNDLSIWQDNKGVPSYWRAWPILELAISDGSYHPKPMGTEPITMDVDWTRVYR